METFIGIMIPFLGTALGSDCVFFMKKSLGDLVQRALAGFAATITPAAKPVRARCTETPSDFFIKNTQAEPSAVPRKGIMIPRKVSSCLTA